MQARGEDEKWFLSGHQGLCLETRLTLFLELHDTVQSPSVCPAVEARMAMQMRRCRVID